MSYTQLMVHDEWAAGTVDDPTEKTLKDFVEKYIEQDIDVANHPLRQVVSQVAYGVDYNHYPVLMYATKDLIQYASDLSALRATNTPKDSNEFDMVRFSNDESWIVDQYLPGISTELVQKLQAYMKHLSEPVHITEVWDDKDSSGVKDDGETLGEHYVFIAKFPNTWPVGQLNSLTVTVRDLLTHNILLKYWETKGYIELEKTERYRIDQLESKLKSVISRRAKPTRRRASLFT